MGSPGWFWPSHATPSGCRKRGHCLTGWFTLAPTTGNRRSAASGRHAVFPRLAGAGPWWQARRSLYDCAILGCITATPEEVGAYFMAKNQCEPMERAGLEGVRTQSVPLLAMRAARTFSSGERCICCSTQRDGRTRRMPFRQCGGVLVTKSEEVPEVETGNSAAVARRAVVDSPLSLPRSY
jgi:hypothetical protein